MSCNRPLYARRFRKSGEVVLGVGLSGSDCDPLELPCGSCYGCRMARALMWKIRIGHEAQLYPSNVVVTLDYAPEALPASLSLEYPDFQGFMKRLRRRMRGVGPGPDGGNPIRFFVAGEYGEETERPHFHAVLFNAWFPDQAKHGRFYRSDLAERIWDRGRVVIDVLSPESAAYVAGYVSKKQKSAVYRDSVVNRATGELSDRRPPFVQMSRRSGIGRGWFERFSGDLFPGDFAVAGGKRHKVPRYYWELWRRRAGNEALAEQLAHARYLRAMESPEESTPERRAVREEVARRRVDFYSPRGL